MVSCSVHHCQSGRVTQRRKLKALGITKALSKFSLPKDEKLRQKWLEILKINLKLTEAKHVKVCELHFQKSDIIRNSTIKLKDGTLYTLERANAKLRFDAIPLSIPREDERFCTSPEKADNERFDDNKETVTEDVIEDMVIIKSEYYSSELEHSYCASSEHSYCASSKDTLAVSPKNNGSGLEHSPFAQNDVVPNSTEYNSFKVEHSSDSNNIPENNSLLCTEIHDKLHTEEDEESAVTEVLPYRLNIKTLKLPEHWSYHIQQDGSTKLNYVHPIRQILYLSCIIYSDMSAEVLALNKRIKRICNVTLSSDEDVIHYLRKLQQWKCCEGLETKDTFSEPCKGFITSSRYTTHRCTACSKQRKDIIRKQSTNLINLHTSRAKVKKLQALLNQVFLLKKQISKKH